MPCQVRWTRNKIEERFGFNRTNLRTFLSDGLKALVVSVLLGAPLLAAILALFEHAGPWAWLYGWALVVLFMVGSQFVAPHLILPLFNTFTPLEEDGLRTTIFRYARSIRFPLENVFVMDGSRRSTKSNAFFTGFGKQRRIALFDTLKAFRRQPLQPFAAPAACRLELFPSTDPAAHPVDRKHSESIANPGRVW